MKQTLVKALLAIAAIVLAFLLYESIMRPIRFNQVQKTRYEATIDKLKDIRKAQQAYKSVNGSYAGNFDDLIEFIKTDSFPIVKKMGEYNMDEMTEDEAYRKGYITRDTIRVSVKDSLFSKRKHLESLRYVPFTAKVPFNLDTATITTGSKVKVKVFEASVPDTVLLHGLNEQLITNFTVRRYKMTGYPGLRVGSLEEATNDAGNWE